jgi:phosphoribosyl-ATP pyrophosphohydrolase/phosphoribosyl-AMP cyclohydrolase
VARLLASGVPKVAQKVGEEAVEVVIDACTGNLEGFKQESADLLFHFLVLLVKLNIPLAEVVGVLEERHKLSKRK